jgi:hypothetical protein
MRTVAGRPIQSRDDVWGAHGGNFFPYQGGNRLVRVRVGPTSIGGRVHTVGDKIITFLAETLSKLRFFVLHSPSTLSTHENI